MDELTISVRIADRPYRLTIKKEEEERVRKAARLINDKLQEYAENYAYNDKQDLISMVALLYATKAINIEEDLHDKDNKLLDRLKDVEKVLSENIT